MKNIAKAKKVKYPPLEGLCKKCELKCGRVGEPSFKGIWRCDYYKEAKDEQQFSKKMS